MKISIITVAFNAAQTIATTLNSVATQTYNNIEHIVVDGASTDRTLEIIKEHGDHISKIISEPDHGIYDAMNKGILASSGNIVGILNADDSYTHPDILKNVANVMQINNLDALLGDVEFFHPNNPTATVRRYRSGRFSPNRIAWGWMPAHPAMFLRKQVYKKYGLYKTDYRIAADFEYVARIFHSSNLNYHHVPEILVRMSTGGVSTGGWRNTILLNREVLRACRENNIRTNLLLLLSKYPAKLYEYFR